MAEDRYYYVGPDKKPVGPYSLDQLRSLAARGVVKPPTKVIRKGDRQWVAYSQLSPSAPAAPSTPAQSKPDVIHVEGVGAVLKSQFTPEMLARLNRENAESGEVEIALMWNTSDDLDLYCIEPGGFRIDFSNKNSSSGGWLDVDMNIGDGGANYSLEPVEHIRWPDGKAPKGEYKVGVILFTHRSSTVSVPFTVAIKAHNEVKEFNMEAEREKEQIHVHTFRIG
ncbi:MAG: DUF4339 domain-containing protein [Verrucomicrobiota bacterium]|nr:DUF4339 domain-containing protein [Verrucomicrobiota bacterium]